MAISDDYIAGFKIMRWHSEQGCRFVLARAGGQNDWHILSFDADGLKLVRKASTETDYLFPLTDYSVPRALAHFQKAAGMFGASRNVLRLIEALEAYYNKIHGIQHD